MNFNFYVPSFVLIYFSEVNPLEHETCKQRKGENEESWKNNYKVVVVVVVVEI